MTGTQPTVRLQDMRADAIRLLVLEEFRLRDPDVDGAAARIVAACSTGIEPAVPLLTSIDDRCDVATLRALHSGESSEGDVVQRAALAPPVSSWATPKHYRPRIPERSHGWASSFRLALAPRGVNGGRAPSR